MQVLDIVACKLGRRCPPEEHGPEEAPVYGGLVHHDRVFLVVSAVAGNGHDGIVPCWQFPVQHHTYSILNGLPANLAHKRSSPSI